MLKNFLNYNPLIVDKKITFKTVLIIFSNFLHLALANKKKLKTYCNKF